MAAKLAKNSSRNRARVSRANDTLILPEDTWKMKLDMLGPFADAATIEALLESAPSGCEDATFARGYIARERMGAGAMTSDGTRFDD